MKEKDFQTKFTNWVKEQDLGATTVWELKICKGTCLPFKQVAPHQIKGLQEAKRGGLYHKISDSLVFGNRRGRRMPHKKPFDCLLINNASAFVVLWFYKPRQPKEMIWIDIDTWVHESEESYRKSITEERAKEIGLTFQFK